MIDAVSTTTDSGLSGSSEQLGLGHWAEGGAWGTWAVRGRGEGQSEADWLWAGSVTLALGTQPLADLAVRHVAPATATAAAETAEAAAEFTSEAVSAAVAGGDWDQLPVLVTAGLGAAEGEGVKLDGLLFLPPAGGVKGEM